LQKAAQALRALHSVTVDVKYPPGVTLPGEGFKNYQVISSSSKIRLPSGDSFTTAKIKTDLGLVDADILTVADSAYLRLFRFLPYQPVSAADYPSPRQMFNAGTGLAAILPRGVNPQYQGTEIIDQHECQKVATSFSGTLVAGAVPLLSGVADVHTELCIDSNSFQIRKAVLNGEFVTPGQKARVEVHLHDFDAPVQIPNPA